MRDRTDEAGPWVAVIDDDADVREALSGLFRSVGLGVQLFETVQAFLGSGNATKPSCLVLDVRLPGKSGLEFQEELNRADDRVPIVFISGHADVAMGVRAIKAGAVEFLTKPVRDQDLLDAVQIAISRSQTIRSGDRRMEEIRAAFMSLTAREQDVLGLVVAGRRNKQIAADLGIAEVTVKLHRSHIMQKLEARSVVDLVRAADAFSVKRKLY